MSDIMGLFGFMNQVTGGVQGALNTAYPNSLASQMAAQGCNIHTHYWDAQGRCIPRGTTLSPASPAVYYPPPPPPPAPPAPTTRPPTPTPTTPAPTTPAPTTPAPTTPTPTQAPTSAAPITPAPTTRASTPSPTPAPMPPPSYLRYPSNLVVFAHEGEWMNKGILKVLTLRGSTPSLQPFVYKDLTQVFAIDSRGAVRCVADQGTYVNPASTCDGVVGGSNASEWRFIDRDLPRSYSVEVKCAIGTRSIEFNNMVHPWAILLGGTSGSSAGWFIVPVARVEST